VETGFVGEIQGTNRVIFGIGNVQYFAVARKRHAVWVTKCSATERAILQTGLAAARDSLDFAVQVGNYDAVMIGVGDEQAIRYGIGQHFPGYESGVPLFCADSRANF
jgi:hypothetical protein